MWLKNISYSVRVIRNPNHFFHPSTAGRSWDLKRPITSPIIRCLLPSSSSQWLLNWVLPPQAHPHRRNSSWRHSCIFSLSWKFSSLHSTQQFSDFLSVSDTENCLLRMLPFSTFNFNVNCQSSATIPLLFSFYTLSTRKIQLFPGLIIPKSLFYPGLLSRTAGPRLSLPTWTSARIAHRCLKLNMSQTDGVPAQIHSSSWVPSIREWHSSCLRQKPTCHPKFHLLFFNVNIQWINKS